MEFTDTLVTSRGRGLCPCHAQVHRDAVCVAVMLKALVGVGHAKYYLSLYEQLNVACSQQTLSDRGQTVSIFMDRNTETLVDVCGHFSEMDRAICVSCRNKATVCSNAMMIRLDISTLRKDMQSTDFVVDDVLWRGHYHRASERRTYVLPRCDEQWPAEIRSNIPS